MFKKFSFLMLIIKSFMIYWIEIKTMAENVGNIAITVGANVIGFVSDMGKATGAVDGFDRKTKSAISSLAKYAAAAVSAGAAVALYNRGSENIDRQAKLARAIGSTTAAVQSLEYASDLAGISQEQLAAASGKLNAKLGQAITVGGAAAKELDRLGLSAEHLASLGADERMAVIADRIVELKYNSSQAAASLKELGLKGNEMVAMMMDGGAQFRDANRELRELNVLVSDVDAAKIEAANDAWTKTNMVLTGVSNTLAVELSPYVQVVAEYLREASVESGGFKTQMNDAIQTGLRGFGHLADVIQGLRAVFKGIELVVVGFGAVVSTLVDAIASSTSFLLDGFVSGINLAIKASNSLLGTSYEILNLPSESAFLKGIHDFAESARAKVGEVRNEFSELAMEQMPSEKIKQFLEDVKNKSNEAASAVVEGRKRMFEMPDQNEDDKKSSQKANSLLAGLEAGTEGMRQELAKRKEILDIYRNNTLAADAPYYAQQLNDIKINEQMKQAEILAASQQEQAQRAQRRADDLLRVQDDRAAIAAVNAEYDAQDILAAQLKQEQLTQVEYDAAEARKKLQYAERQRAISVALGLGQQLMSVAQGHSKRMFEFAKVAAIASAVVDGQRAAVAAWKDGMTIGGPPMAVAFTASSLLQTGSLIQSIRGANFSGGAGGGGAGEASVAAPAAASDSAPAAGANAGSTMYVEGVDPSHFFTGAAVRTIAQELLNFQKDGGKVVFNA